MPLSLVKEGEETSSTLALVEQSSNSALSDKDKARLALSSYTGYITLNHSAEGLLDTIELDAQNNFSVITNHWYGVDSW